MNRLCLVLLPELRGFPGSERDGALKAARGMPFDLPELAGMAAALVLVTGLTRYGVGESNVAARLGAAVAHFIVALPLLAAGLGPFQLRRLRRGLREQLRRRGRS